MPVKLGDRLKTDRRYEGEEMRKIACAIAMVAIAFFIVAVVGWELKYPSERPQKRQIRALENRFVPNESLIQSPAR